MTMQNDSNLAEQLIETIQSQFSKYLFYQPKWLSLQEAAKYAGVSYNTFIKFRQMGLKVCEIDGIKRVSIKEIDRFLEEHSF